LSLCFINWVPRHEGVLRQWRYSSTHSLTSALNGGELSASCPGHFTPRERAPGSDCMGGWVGPRAVLDLKTQLNMMDVLKLSEFHQKSCHILSFHIKNLQTESLNATSKHCRDLTHCVYYLSDMRTKKSPQAFLLPVV
jgi:hypothetical protein